MDMSQKTMETDGYQVKTTIPHLPSSLSDHPSLVGIIRLPYCNTIDEDVNISIPQQNNNTWEMVTQKVKMATEINQITIESTTFTVDKSKITDFYPYTYYVLTDGECDPLVMLPQYMPSKCSIKAKFALSHQPIERYYIEGYKGDYDGNVYNITNLNQMMLPTATNEGLAYMNGNANTIMQNRKSTITNNVLSAIGSIGGTVASATSGNFIQTLGVASHGFSNLLNGLNEIKNIDSRNKDILLTPNSISSFGNPSTRNAFNCNKVKVLKYTVSDNIKNKVQNFTDRYGNKFNSYDTISLKSYKGYIKFISPDIDGKIDNMYMNKIISILERGIYIE